MNALTTARKDLKPADIQRVFAIDSKLSPLTVRGYAGSTVDFFTWARDNGIPGPGAVSQAAMAAYKRTLIDAGLKNGTINYKLKAVRAFYRLAIRAGELDTNPTDSIGYEPEERFTAEYKALTKKQVEILLRALAQDDSERGRQRYAVILLLTLTGVRASEACHLQFKDLIFDGNLTGLSYQDITRRKLNAVAVRVERGKGGKSRTVEFRQDILDAVIRYRKAAHVQGENLFYTIPQNSRQTRTALDRFNLFHLIRKVCRDILDIDVHPHSFRHTNATISLELGADIYSISQNLGHSSIDMTSRYLQRRGSVLKYWSGLAPATI